MTSKTILILASGGLDSTYLMWKALEEGHKVIPVYVEIMNNSPKAERERKALDEIIRKLRKKYGGESIAVERTIMSLDVESRNECTMAQAPIWLLSLIFSPLKDVDEVHIGYVMGDCGVSYISELKRIWTMYKQNFMSNRAEATLKFPLIKFHKHDLMDQLPNEIFQLTVFCESSINGNDCGSCVPCKTAKESETYYKYIRNSKQASSELEATIAALSEPTEDLIEKAKEPTVNNLIDWLQMNNVPVKQEEYEREIEA